MQNQEYSQSETKEMSFASKNMASFFTHKIVVRETDGLRSSKSFSFNSQGLTARQIYEELMLFNKKVLVNKFKADLILTNNIGKNATHSILIEPYKDEIKENDKMITLYVRYPHYSCLDIARELEGFLCWGRVRVK